MASETKLITAAEFAVMPGLGRCELIEGEIVDMVAPGGPHGYATMNLAGELRSFVRKRKLGRVYSETGYLVSSNPDSVRVPDASFISEERLAGWSGLGFYPGAPDVAIETISPTDTWSEVSRKADMWLEAGASSVWLVHPEERTITLRSSGSQNRKFAADETFTDPALPGFSVAVHEIFE